MSLLAIGSVAFDGIKTPGGEVDRVVGGSATYFSLSASFFTDVAVVAVVGEDFTDTHMELFASKGIDTRQVRREKGLSFYWKGEYNDNLSEARTLATELNVFADFRPEIHPDYRRSRFLFLGNIDPALQSHVLDQVSGPELVGLDTMNYWIQQKLPALFQVLARVDVLFINDAEARQLAGERNLVAAARKIAALGPRVVVVKRGENGVMVFNQDQIFLTPAYPLAEVRDTTGAGDTFAGGFMGYLAGAGRVDPGEVRKAALYGTVMASFNIESFSVERLRHLTFPEISDRYRRFQAMITV